MHDYSTLMSKLSVLGSDMFDADLLLETAFQYFGDIDTTYIEKFRREFRDELQRDLEARRVRKELCELHRATHFDWTMLESLQSWFEQQPKLNNGINMTTFRSIIKQHFSHRAEWQSKEFVRCLFRAFDE